MDNIISPAKIRGEQLDKSNYTLSLLSLCLRDGIISQGQQNKILSDFNAQFLETARQYAHRESSTIPKSIAQNIYLSLFFQSDVYLLGLKSAEKAAETLIESGVDKITAAGKLLLLQSFKRTRLIYSAAKAKRLSTENEEYIYAMNGAYVDFCTGYSARFDALNCCCKITYPLLNKHPLDMPERGVMFMLEYYSCILLENRFCGFFTQAEINRVLAAYGRAYGVPYDTLLVNVSSVLLGNLLAALLLDKPPLTLSLSRRDADGLAAFCEYISLDTLIGSLEKAFELCKAIFGKQLHDYLSAYIPTFASELYSRAHCGGIENYLALE